jgi:urease beta subunit
MKHLRGIILQFGLICIGFLPFTTWAQTNDTLNIKGIQKIAKGQELKINAGTQVRFASGAALWIEGSLFVTGDSKAPVAAVRGSAGEVSSV